MNNYKKIGEITSRSPMVVFLWSAEEGWPVELVSENVEALTGYSIDVFLNGDVSYALLIHEIDSPRVTKEVNYYSADNQCNSFMHEPYRIKHKDGHVIWVEDRTNIIRDSEGNIVQYEGMVHDCTARMQIEQALHEKERYIRDIEMLSGVANGEYSLEVDHLYSSPNLAHLLNTEEQDQNQSLSTIEFAIHPEDRKRVIAHHIEFKKGVYPYTMEYRIVTHDNQVRYIREMVRVEVEEYHENRILFFFHDITTYKKDHDQ